MAEWIVFILGLIGTTAFAISGVMVAIDKELDLLGVIVLGVVTSVGGGMIRDVLLGLTPPTMFLKPIYVAVAFAVSLTAFFAAYLYHGFMEKNLEDKGQDKRLRQKKLHEKLLREKLLNENVLNIFDAIGLGIFVTLGVDTAIQNGYADNHFLSIFVGVITGVGGGLLRDMMAGEIPIILRKRVYAVAALGGAALYFLLYYSMKMNRVFSLFAAAVLTVMIRLLAARFGWNLPRIRKQP